jgi:hypothetical protein
MRRKLRAPVVVALSALSLLLLASNAAADQVFHTLHANLVPVNGAPLQSGFVNDVHTNGVVNAAHEIYHLNGAAPNTTYQVTIFLYLFDPTCSTAPLSFPTAQVTTNGAGNGNANFTFPAGPPSPLAGPTHGALWSFTGPTGLAYQTACNPVVID